MLFIFNLLDTELPDRGSWQNCPIWERPGSVSRIPDMVSFCCAGFLTNVWRLTTTRWLHAVTQKTEILVSIHSIIQQEFFLILTYHIMKWPTCTVPYVTKYYNRHVCDCIVVSVNSRQNKTWFTGIYVTRHLGLGHFDETCSYQISQGLID